MARPSALTEAQRHRRRVASMVLLTALTLAVFAVGCCLGPYAIAPNEVLATLLGQGTARQELIVFDFRLTRLCLALLVGVGMGASGVIMQNLLHNDLASPGTLGVADGSSLFVTAYVALAMGGGSDNPALMPVLALAGGILSALVIYALGTRGKRQVSSTRLVMCGVAMGAFYSALSTFAMYVLDETQLEFVQRWQSGELWGTEWPYIAVLAVWSAAFLAWAMWRSKTLDVIGLGFDTACGLGVNVRRSFLELSLVSVALSAGAVAFGGNFFFLGLIGPHIARRIVGTEARYLIPASGLTSSLIIVSANILVENVPAFINIPTGIFVSVLAVPYFIYLLMRSR